ncbi:MAG: hypothetical protein AABY26_04225 [Nanoarchaeota archaeon]
MEEKNRLINPVWNETLKFLVGMLDEDKSVELMKEISKSYLEAKREYLSGESMYNFNTIFNHSRLLGECLTQKQCFRMHRRDNNHPEIIVECDNGIIKEAALDWIWASINPYDLNVVSIPTPQGLIMLNTVPNLPYGFNTYLAHDLGIAQFTSVAFEAYLGGMFKMLDDLKDVPTLFVWETTFKSMTPQQRDLFITSLKTMARKGDRRAVEVLEKCGLEDYLG